VVSKRFHLTLFISLLFLLFSPKFGYCQTYNDSGYGWRVAELYIADNTVNIYSNKSKNSEIINVLVFDEKVLILDVDEDIKSELFVRIIYPAEGYIERTKLKATPYIRNEDELILSDQVNANWTSEILFGNNEYTFIKEDASYAARNIATFNSGYPILVIKQKEFEQQTWLKAIYPSKGFVHWSKVESSHNLFFFEFGFTTAPLNFPYEKEFKHKNSPIGGYIKFSNDAWNLGTRLYYTIEKTRTNLFELETQRAGLEINYDFIKLFDDKLTVYGFVGGGYWASTFRNTKYPNMSYYKTETASGPMYNAGGGFNVMYYNFVFDVHYAWFGTEEGVFGADPVPGMFMNQYKFFVSAHQLLTSIGYRIEL
jgi:hypothetical protein